MFWESGNLCYFKSFGISFHTFKCLGMPLPHSSLCKRHQILLGLIESILQRVEEVIWLQAISGILLCVVCNQERLRRERREWGVFHALDPLS